MKRGLLFALLGASVLLLVSRRAFSSSYGTTPDYALDPVYNPDDDFSAASNGPDYWLIPSGTESGFVYGVDMSADQNLLAFLALIREFESNNDYSVVYGGKHFSGFTEHPRIKTPINLPGYEGKYSTAAGAYQFLYKTWNNLRNRLGLADFSPASQDAAAVELLRDIGALPYVEAGDFDQALRIASSQWASLPYSTAQQNPQTILAANEFLRRYIG